MDSDGDGLPDEQEYEYGTFRHDEDSDDDGIIDGREVELGTDPTEADTDGDRLTDYAEVEGDGLTGADPHRKDIFVEVDTVGECDLSSLNIERIRDAFATAPVENPDGSKGISLHIVHSEHLEDTTETLQFKNKSGPRNDVMDLRHTHFNNSEGGGYHYAVVAPDIRSEQPVDGMAALGVAASECTGSKKSASRTFMHELGHSLGLSDDEYERIDAESPPSEYPSVMNYHSGVDELDYAATSADGWSDWQFIQEKMYAPRGNRTAPWWEYSEYG